MRRARQAVLRACHAAPKPLACEAIVDALAAAGGSSAAAGASAARGLLTSSGFRALCDLLRQSARSNAPTELGRLWGCGVRLLVATRLCKQVQEGVVRRGGGRRIG